MENKEKLIQWKLVDIMEWCQENHQVAWLKNEVQKTKQNDKGETVPVSFIDVRREWAKKFMPELIEKKKAKKSKSMLEKVMAMSD